MNGDQAHANGEPISACPFAPADPQGAQWRADWIRAEALARHRAGTYGATDEQYRAAGLTPPGPRTERIGMHLDREQVEALARAAKILGERFRELARKLASLDWQSIVADLERIGALPPSTPPAPTSQHRICPRHGAKGMRSGNCLRCQREVARRTGRR